MEILDSVDDEQRDLPWPHTSEAPHSQTPACPTLAEPCWLPPKLLLSIAFMAQKVIFSWLILWYQNGP